MKENAKFLKLNDKYEELKRKYDDAKEQVETEKTDKQILEMKLANMQRGDNINNPRGGGGGGRAGMDFIALYGYEIILYF